MNCGNAAREGALGYDLGAPHLTIGTIYLVGEHSVLPRYGYMGAWANTVHPYGYTGADCLYGGVRVPRPTEKVKTYVLERIK